MSNKKEDNQESKASEFVQKWAGFLKDDDVENSKHNYFIQKYKL